MENLPVDHWVTSLQFTPKTYQEVYPAIDPANNSLAGKVVIITGASQGIGGDGIAPSFAKAGPKALVLIARGEEKLKEVEAKVQKINSSIKTLAVPMDITSESAVADLFARVKSTFGVADVLINNACVNEGGPVIHEADTSKWWSNFDVNLKAPFMLSKAFINQLPSKDYKATIGTLTTFTTYQVFPFMAGYAISKLGAQMLAANIASAYPNITCAIIHPGLVETRQLLPAFSRFNLDPPDLVGSLLVWFASDPERSNFLSGRLITANWDVEGLLARKDEILGSNKLQLSLEGPFGKEQFDGES